MKIVPISFKEACLYIDKFHRHHKKPQGCKFCLRLEVENETCGVLIAGRPVARMLDDGFTLEITRLCTTGLRNACSKLYTAAVRAAKELGYRRVITYILDSENGASLKASGFKMKSISEGGSWSRPSRNRYDKAPLNAKKRYQIDFKED